jgi:DNA-directed RNA polymerase specialized sigma24 family protein
MFDTLLSMENKKLEDLIQGFNELVFRYNQNNIDSDNDDLVHDAVIRAVKSSSVFFESVVRLNIENLKNSDA